MTTPALVREPAPLAPVGAPEPPLVCPQAADGASAVVASRTVRMVNFMAAPARR